MPYALIEGITGSGSRSPELESEWEGLSMDLLDELAVRVCDVDAWV